MADGHVSGKSAPVRAELTVHLNSGDEFVYQSEGEFGDIGRVTRAYYRSGGGQPAPMPYSGDIHQLCESYPAANSKGARLSVDDGEWVFVDEVGHGRVSSAEGPCSVEFAATVETMAEAAVAAFHQKGRSLHQLLGNSVRPADVPTIPGSCGSQIKLIAESARYKQYALLHASLASGEQPNEVHRYKIGGDIFFLFTRGQAVVNHTSGRLREFHSVPVSIGPDNTWQIVVLPPQEFYQVLNTGSGAAEYFMFFMEHNDAYARNAFEQLTQEQNVAHGWGFAYPES
jgi:hypothetical protein